MNTFETSLARRGLDALLERYPFFDLLDVKRSVGGERYGLIGNPWMVVVLGQRSEGESEAFARWEFAIWLSTGAVHSLRDGAVSDDPIIEV